MVVPKRHPRVRSEEHLPKLTNFHSNSNPCGWQRQTMTFSPKLSSSICKMMSLSRFEFAADQSAKSRVPRTAWPITHVHLLSAKRMCAHAFAIRRYMRAWMRWRRQLDWSRLGLTVFLCGSIWSMQFRDRDVLGRAPRPRKSLSGFSCVLSRKNRNWTFWFFVAWCERKVSLLSFTKTSSLCVFYHFLVGFVSWSSLLVNARRFDVLVPIVPPDIVVLLGESVSVRPHGEEGVNHSWQWMAKGSGLSKVRSHRRSRRCLLLQVSESASTCLCVCVCSVRVCMSAYALVQYQSGKWIWKEQCGAREKVATTESLTVVLIVSFAGQRSLAFCHWLFRSLCLACACVHGKICTAWNLRQLRDATQETDGRISLAPFLFARRDGLLQPARSQAWGSPLVFSFCISFFFFFVFFGVAQCHMGVLVWPSPSSHFFVICVLGCLCSCCCCCCCWWWWWCCCSIIFIIIIIPFFLIIARYFFTISFFFPLFLSLPIAGNWRFRKRW